MGAREQAAPDPGLTCLPAPTQSPDTVAVARGCLCGLSLTPPGGLWAGLEPWDPVWRRPAQAAHRGWPWAATGPPTAPGERGGVRRLSARASDHTWLANADHSAPSASAVPGAQHTPLPIKGTNADEARCQGWAPPDLLPGPRVTPTLRPLSSRDVFGTCWAPGPGHTPVSPIAPKGQPA